MEIGIMVALSVVVFIVIIGAVCIWLDRQAESHESSK